LQPESQHHSSFGAGQHSRLHIMWLLARQERTGSYRDTERLLRRL
jgi:hypothetical protein